MKSRKSLLLILATTTLLLSVILTLGILAADDQSVTLGDVNDDTIVNLQDLILLRQYFASYNYDDKDSNPTLPAGADTNRDGKITALDIVVLRDFLANLDFPENPDLPTNPDEPDEPDTPEAQTPFNLYLDAESLNNCVNTPPYDSVANKKSNEYVAATNDDIAFTRLKGVASQYLYFYYYYNANSDKVTGQYFVIKYRLPEGTSGASIGSYVGSSTSPNDKATSGSGESFTVETYATGGWVIGVYDMSKTAHYGAKEDGTYSAKYLRLDLYFSSTTEYYDIAYVGVCDNLDAIYPNIGENTTCNHPIKNYQYTASTHTEKECAICHSASTGSATDHTWSSSRYDELLDGYVISCSVCGYKVVQNTNNAVNEFFSAVTVKNKEGGASGSAKFTSSALMSDETEPLFVRFTGRSSVPSTVLIDNKLGQNIVKNNKESGHYLAIKYRFPSTNTVKPTSMMIYASGTEGASAASSNGFALNVYSDNEWHVAIIDLSNTGATDAFVGDKITLLRLDLFGWSTPGDDSSVDIAYVAIDDNIDDIRNMDDDYETYGLVGYSEIKTKFGSNSTEGTDTEHNDLSYARVTGISASWNATINDGTNMVYGGGKIFAILYRKDPSTAYSTCRLYFNSLKSNDKYYVGNYICDGKWHLMTFDFTGEETFTDPNIRTLLFNVFNFGSKESTVDIAYLKFFDSPDEAYAYYGEYVKTYFDQDSCDHVVVEWKYGSDGDTIKEYAVCKHCGKQTDESRDISFNVTLDKVTDSNGTYPSAYDGTIGTAENAAISFNSTNYSNLYPANGLTVAANQELSIAGQISLNGDIESIWFKVVNASGTVVSAWKECRYSISGSKFAAYADFDGITGTDLTVIFAATPTGLDEGVVDAYLHIVSVEGISVSEEAEEKAGFTANADLGDLMDNVFEGNYVMNETVMFLDYGDSKSMMYYIDKIISVKSYDGKTTYVEGVDYALVDGKIIILEGSAMPCITSAVYYNVESDKFQTYLDGVATNTHYGEAWSMTNWQVIVEYEHSDNWNGYEQANQSDYYADFIEKLMNGEDVTIIYYGDSITAGANSSFMHNYAQQQYGYALLLTNAIADAFGYTVRYIGTDTMQDKMGNVPTSDYVGGTRGTITYINTAVGGKNSNWGRINVQEYVIDYINEYGCDLFICAFGMNDLDATARITRSNVKNIVDPILTASPDTSVMLVSTMFYNNVAVDGERRNNLIKEQDVELKSLADDYRAAGYECAVTSMSLVSESILEHKDFMDYTGNNVNHPNDYFCRIYAQTLFEALIGYDNLLD